MVKPVTWKMCSSTMNRPDMQACATHRLSLIHILLQKPGCALRVDSLRAMAPNGGLIRRILRVGIPAGIENGMRCV